MQIALFGQRKNARPRRNRLAGPSPALKIVLFFAALAAVPALAVLARTLRLSVVLRQAPDGGVLGLPPHAGWFVAGAAAFAIVFACVRLPARAYVFVHEATHAIFGLLGGARISRFRVGDEQGSVDVSRPNAVNLLAPYFFPLPCVAALVLFGLVSLVAPLVGTIAGNAFCAVAGVAWGFHFCYTLNALLQRQTDLEPYGFFFSVITVLLLNAAFMLVADIALGPATCSSALRGLRETAAQTYGLVLDIVMPSP